jgi:hypothetical protein
MKIPTNYSLPPDKLISIASRADWVKEIQMKFNHLDEDTLIAVSLDYWFFSERGIMTLDFLGEAHTLLPDKLGDLTHKIGQVPLIQNQELFMLAEGALPYSVCTDSLISPSYGMGVLHLVLPRQVYAIKKPEWEIKQWLDTPNQLFRDLIAYLKQA